jgi:hypothetical protein
MTKQEIDAAIRNIASLARAINRDEWALASALATFTPLEYEQNLPRIVSETGWTRQRLTALRMTGKQWPVEKRFADVPFSLHQQFRYKPKELIAAHQAGTLGQVTPTRRRQLWTLSVMQSGLRSIIALVDDPTVSDAECRAKIAEIVLFWRPAVNAAA